MRDTKGIEDKLNNDILAAEIDKLSAYPQLDGHKYLRKVPAKNDPDLSKKIYIGKMSRNRFLIGFINIDGKFVYNSYKPGQEAAIVQMIADANKYRQILATIQQHLKSLASQNIEPWHSMNDTNLKSFIDGIHPFKREPVTLTQLKKTPLLLQPTDVDNQFILHYRNASGNPQAETIDLTNPNAMARVVELVSASHAKKNELNSRSRWQKFKEVFTDGWKDFKAGVKVVANAIKKTWNSGPKGKAKIIAIVVVAAVVLAAIIAAIVLSHGALAAPAVVAGKAAGGAVLFAASTTAATTLHAGAVLGGAFGGILGLILATSAIAGIVSLVIMRKERLENERLERENSLRGPLDPNFNYHQEIDKGLEANNGEEDLMLMAQPKVDRVNTEDMSLYNAPEALPPRSESEQSPAALQPQTASEPAPAALQPQTASEQAPQRPMSPPTWWTRSEDLIDDTTVPQRAWSPGMWANTENLADSDKDKRLSGEISGNNPVDDKDSAVNKKGT